LSAHDSTRMENVTLIRWTMTPATRSTILAALSEAADAKRDKIDMCPDDHSQGCETCAFRAEAAASYDHVTEIMAETDRPGEPDLDDDWETSVWRDGYEAGARDEAASCAPRPREPGTDKEAGS
jgi:hypothetical protein